MLGCKFLPLVTARPCKFWSTEPDLVILDIMMPKVDGYGVTKEIRANHDTPIIILTALGDVAERITGLELEAQMTMWWPLAPKG